MKNLLTCYLAWLCILTYLSTTNPSIANSCITPPNLKEIRSAHLASVNSLRTKANVTRLRNDQTLDVVAQDYACLLASTGHFGHRGPDGSELTERVPGFGTEFCFVAENLARGQPSLQQAIRDWQGSRAHRKNLQLKAAQQVGFGVALTGVARQPVVWVQVFGSRC